MKLSAKPQVFSLLATDLMYVVQNAKSKRIEFQNVLTSISSAFDNWSNKQNTHAELNAFIGLAPNNNDILQRKNSAWITRSPSQFKTDLQLNSGDVGLSFVDNVRDINKPISLATQAALNTKAPVIAKYILLEPHSSLTEHQVLGLQSNQLEWDLSGQLTDPQSTVRVLKLAQNPILPGKSHVTIPFGNVAERPASPTLAALRYNTDHGVLEGYSVVNGTSPSLTLVQRSVLNRRRIIVADEFMFGSVVSSGTAIYGEMGWSVGSSGAAANSFISGIANHPGILQIGTPNPTNGYTALHFGTTVTTPIVISNQVEYMSFLINIQSITGVRIIAGIGRDVSNNTYGSESVRFQFDPAVNANMQFICRNAGSETVVTLSSVSANTWYLLEMAFDGVSWVPTMNGLPFAGITTDIPIVQMNVGLSVFNVSSGSHSVQIDRFEMISRELSNRY